MTDAQRRVHEQSSTQTGEDAFTAGVVFGAVFAVLTALPVVAAVLTVAGGLPIPFLNLSIGMFLTAFMIVMWHRYEARAIARENAREARTIAREDERDAARFKNVGQLAESIQLAEHRADLRAVGEHEPPLRGPFNR